MQVRAEAIEQRMLVAEYRAHPEEFYEYEADEDGEAEDDEAEPEEVHT